MTVIIRLLLILLTCLACTNTQAAFAAEDTPAPDAKEAFLSAWESHIKSLPTTVVFQKTDEPGIYDFETTLFPYKGKLELLNIVVSKDIDYYEDYDLNHESVSKGVAEIRLTDLPKEEFREKYNYSKEIWDNKQFLFFMNDAAGGRWLSAEEWWTAKNNGHAPTKAPSCNAQNTDYLNLFLKWLPLIILMSCFFIIVKGVSKRQKSYYDKYENSLAKQLEGIEIAKCSLALQEEQRELLRKIAENKQGS